MNGEIVHVTKAGTEVVRFDYGGRRRNTAHIAEEQRLCYQLRVEFYSIRQIAQMTGLSVGTVHKRITDQIDETISPYRERARVYARDRWDMISRRLVDLMDGRRYLMERGKVVTIDGEPVVDHMFQLLCIDRLAAVEKQRARSEGYEEPDAPHAPQDGVLPEDIEVAGLIRAARERAAAQAAALGREGEG